MDDFVCTDSNSAKRLFPSNSDGEQTDHEGGALIYCSDDHSDHEKDNRHDDFFAKTAKHAFF